MSAEERKFDVLGLGVLAVDELLYVEHYPPPDSKTPVLHRERQAGGLTGTALVAAARLGAKCAYAGMLGHDELSQFVADTFRREGIDLTHVVWRDDAQPVHSFIIVDTTAHTRNIFFLRGAKTGAAPDAPLAEVIRSTRVLFADHHGLPGMVRAARIASEVGIPVVADFERAGGEGFEELIELTTHLIVSREFAEQFAPGVPVAEAVKRIRRHPRQTVVVTCGAEGCWYLGEGTEEPVHQPAYRVQVVDTTGCGDVFHGAYAAALARGLSLPERIRIASATAAIKARYYGGQAGIPTWEEVTEFLHSRKDTP
ncbi:Sulfofructose kinase [bacterium HR16]|nr:Sulfofructose kinase [bacterium HR16]